MQVSAERRPRSRQNPATRQGCVSAAAPCNGRRRYGDGVTTQPTGDPGPDEPYEVIHLGGQAAAIVPLADLQRLRAVERRAPAEILAEADIETTLAAHREWVAAGRPGAISHDEAMAELLDGP